MSGSLKFTPPAFNIVNGAYLMKSIKKINNSKVMYNQYMIIYVCVKNPSVIEGFTRKNKNGDKNVVMYATTVKNNLIIATDIKLVGF